MAAVRVAAVLGLPLRFAAPASGEGWTGLLCALAHQARYHVQGKRLGQPRFESLDCDGAHHGVVGAERQRRNVHYIQHDRYPPTDIGIAALVEKTDDFPDGLLNKLPKDPWGSPYTYLQPGRQTAYEVISYGADKQEGGTAADKDISKLRSSNAKFIA